MKKVWNYLRSMKFGILLLILLSAVSAAGSFVSQNEEPMYYVRTYPKAYSWIFALKLNQIYTSWYFILITVLLCLNLTFCSIIRIRKLIRSKEEVERAAFAGSPEVFLSKEGISAVQQEMEKMHCAKSEKDGVIVYTKNHFGRYGTFFVHLGLLFTLIFFSLGMSTPVIIDQSCYPHDSITLDDGTEIYVDSFRIEDSQGKLDFRSSINVTLPDGKTSGLKETSVNHPVTLGDYKVYQQTYGTAGVITVSDDKGNSDSFYMEPGDFLSTDGKNGLLYDNLYPDFQKDENGKTSMITSVSGRYENPVYVFTTVDNGQQNELMLAFPGDDMDIAGYHYHFETPVEYPGLRIKKASRILDWCLLASVVLMTAGFVLAFFMNPVVVTLTEEGYAVSGRAEGLRLTLKSISKKYEREKETVTNA